MQLFFGALIWFVAWLSPIVLTIVFQDRIHWILARLLGGFVPQLPRSVEGLWVAEYTYTSAKEPELQTRNERQVIELRQLGRHVWGRNLTGTDHWYKMQGGLDQETYFTGTWASKLENSIYRGAFQLVLDADGKAMKGKWVGFNRRQEINSGNWEWTLVTSAIDHVSKSRLLHGSMGSHRAGSSPGSVFTKSPNFSPRTSKFRN